MCLHHDLLFIQIIYFDLSVFRLSYSILKERFLNILFVIFVLKLDPLFKNQMWAETELVLAPYKASNQYLVPQKAVEKN